MLPAANMVRMRGLAGLLLLLTVGDAAEAEQSGTAEGCLAPPKILRHHLATTPFPDVHKLSEPLSMGV